MPDDDSRFQPPELRPTAVAPRAETSCETPHSQSIEAMHSLALLSADLLHRLENRYIDVLEELVESFCARCGESIRSDHLTHLKRLRTRDGRRILEIIWKETCQIPRIAFTLSGTELSFSGRVINSNSLAAELFATQPRRNNFDYDTAQATAQQVSRIVDAAEFFGLIEKDTPVGKSIPIKGTDVLSTLMLACHIENGMLVDSLYRPSNISKPQGTEYDK